MIRDIRLQNFRSYQDYSFEFGDGVNIIVGPNASGKTNLLESLLVVCKGSSYRVKDLELIAYNNPWARLTSHTPTEERVVKIIKNRESVQKNFEINSKQSRRITKDTTIPTVLFEPDHLLMLSSSPDRRREYLDSILESTITGYSVLRRQYQRALAQRNALLKRGSSSKKLLFPWNLRLSDIGGTIANRRAELVDRINQSATTYYSKLSGRKAKVIISYKTSLPINNYSSQLLKKLELSMNNDYQRGFTTQGPHRDDMSIELNGHYLQETASRGEVRTMVLVLKIAELNIKELATNKHPILLLDDVFSELDGARRHALITYIQNYQTFITTTDADAALGYFDQTNNVIALSL